MYYNDVHIIIYVIFGLIGLLIGKLLPYINERLQDEKRIFTKEFLRQNKKVYKYSIIYMVVLAVLYILILYRFGINDGFINNINLIKYLIIAPLLVSVFAIDYKLQIIPNRLNMTLFEIGLITTFIQGIYNINVVIDSVLGLLVGGGIFLLLTAVGGLIAGKEAMGFGDVKLMGALGLFFGPANIIVVTVIGFLISAIVSVILLITKVKKTNEYIPFGPFLVIGAFISIIIPFEILLVFLLEVFSLGMYSRVNY